jgi:hypothetical protein
VRFSPVNSAVIFVQTSLGELHAVYVGNWLNLKRFGIQILG